MQTQKMQKIAGRCCQRRTEEERQCLQHTRQADVQQETAAQKVGTCAQSYSGQEGLAERSTWQWTAGMARHSPESSASQQGPRSRWSQPRR